MISQNEADAGEAAPAPEAPKPQRKPKAKTAKAKPKGKGEGKAAKAKTAKAKGAAKVVRKDAPKRETKQAKLIELVGRAKGASIDEIAEVFGWLPHTIRASMTGLRRLGHKVDSERDEKRGRVYRIAA